MPRVLDSPAITSIDHTTFMVGVPGEFTFTTTLKSLPRSFSEWGPLPCGVTFTDMGDGTAILAGKPGLGTVGRYPINVTAFHGSSHDACQEFTLTVHRTTPPHVSPGWHADQRPADPSWPMAG